MIRVKFLGGAKKSFSTGELTLQNDNLTIKELLDLLLKTKPQDTPQLDIDNILIAVNGTDSSALDGKNTKLKNNDVVSIIPVIHGGTSDRVQFQISKSIIELIEIKSRARLDVNFLIDLRKKFSNLIIQGVDSRFILSKLHAKKIIKISLEAKKNQNMLSKKLEIDILMRFACTTQISEAMKTAGMKPRKNFILVVLGNKLNLNKLYSELSPYLDSKTISTNNSIFMKKQFNISKKQIDSTSSVYPLEDLLVEKAAVLFQ